MVVLNFFIFIFGNFWVLILSQNAGEIYKHNPFLNNQIKISELTTMKPSEDSNPFQANPFLTHKINPRSIATTYHSQNYHSGRQSHKETLVESFSKCPNGQTGQFVYEFSCNQFLNCWKGRGYAQNCPPGTLFNPKSLECDFAEKVECISGPKKAQIIRQVSDKIQAGCPAGFSGIIPHYTDCKKFINCASGRENVMDCAPGTLFDIRTNLCDFPNKAQCVNGQNKEIERQNYVGGQVHYQTIRENYVASGINENSRSGHVLESHQNFGTTPKCPSDFTGIKPHPTDCAKFLNCANGQTYIQDCGPGTHFNPQILVCDFPYRVKCRNGGGNQPQNEGNSNKQFSGQNGVYNNFEQSGSYSRQNEQTGGYGYNQLNFGQNGNYEQGYKQTQFYNGHAGGGQAPSGYNHQNSRNYGTESSSFSQNSGGYGQFGSGSTISQNSENFGHSSHSSSQQTENIGRTQFTSGAYEQASIYNGRGQNGQFTGGQNGQIEIYEGYTGIRQGGNVIRGQNGQSSRSEDFDQSSSGFYTSPPKGGKIGQSGYFVQSTYKNSNSDLKSSGNENYQIFHQTTSKPFQEISGDSEARSKHWPPPFPSTDVNADYVFEYEDLHPEIGSVSKPSNPDWCNSKGFDCGNKMCLSPDKACDGKKDCLNGQDEINCSEAIRKFTKTPNTKLAVKEIEKLNNVTLKWCAKICYEKKAINCKSFNYRKNDGTCFLLNSNVGLSGALIILQNYDYYENDQFTIRCNQGFLCNNKKCLRKEQICNGVNDCGDGFDEKGCTAEAFEYKVRLAGSPTKNSGRILIDAFGYTGYVCDDMFGLRNADVVCRELGFDLGALEVKGNSYFAKDIKENGTFYMMDDVSCLGNETSLRDCDFGGWGIHNCQDQEIVGVICKTPTEVCPEDHWKCKSGNECLPLPFVCDGVYDCTDKSDEDDEICVVENEVRLVNGTSNNNGRVEIKHHGIWGTICDDDFSDDAAKVLCHQLGFDGNARVIKDGQYGPGTGPIWLDQVFCHGNESKIDDCIHWDYGEHNCEHSEDVGIACGGIGKPRNMKLDDDFEPDDSLPTNCGLRSDAMFQDNSDVHFRVVKGTVARPGDYPWQASIRVKGKTKPAHWCGAVVISEKYILTAAHCLVGFSKGAYFVVAGDYNVDIQEGTEQEAYIEDFIIHEDFRKGTKMNNDIALIKLKGRGFRLTKDVQAICLPDSNFKEETGLNCTISGFGSIESGKSRASRDLRAGWVPIQSKDICKMPHVYGEALTSGMLCAGYMNEGLDACDGDSGGPLACLHEGVFKLIGITSWGQHCGYANKPGVYVKVGHYKDWIIGAMNKL